jgi:hypothetical protein
MGTANKWEETRALLFSRNETQIIAAWRSTYLTCMGAIRKGYWKRDI